MAQRCSVIANLFALRYVPHDALNCHLFEHLLTNGFGGLGVSVLAFSTQVCGFKPV
jgi:hypothetical protein